ncbi:TetR/AcrR family transcriptional regulator [Halopseudomonas pelagia]|uniref:TetR family transcriptional regulator n=1 Tax=Halopseudomonas pelagia TaxID=553151 RepID=A0AA91Z7J0_9GAMM|nr:TetR/AcrR family transcriptional regulator [Halopseudomonas pelagia]PCD01118.1 TetR family transcriptional regulator [Halopseudomonas pelagia]QFY54983.1 TetR/AcrR family transcriptional regulator [Halopseudomonas pelagia]
MNRDTRKDLMDRAEHIVRSRGFDGFSYADLAEAIGIRKASIHYHFPTKAKLSEALIERYQTSLQHGLAEIEAARASAGERLKALIALYRGALHDGQTVCLCVAFSTCRESLSETVIARVGAIREMILQWLMTMFELGQRDGSVSAIHDSTPEAHATLAILEGAHLAARTEQNPAVFDAATQLLRARCLRTSV